MSVTLLKRLRSMDGAELKFRAQAALRARMRHAHSKLRPPGWRRETLHLSLTSGLVAACDAISRNAWLEAHRCLAAHFARRPPHFPLDPRQLDSLSARIAARFSTADAIARAERLLLGRYDLLGYRDVAAGSPPDWHRDPVNGRRAALTFWDAVPYLDPACGDHKITWELNRHQHFLVLGRAYALSGDRRFYREFVRQLTDWIRNNPPLTGTNWASMLEVAFRCLSWTWALHFFAPAAAHDDEEPWTVDLLLALDRQLEHVEENLSRYFSPNTHLTGEALALYVTGRALPELRASARRAAIGRDVLLSEATRQVLDDGGHAERSTHYHRYSTDFYLFAFNVARASADPHAIELRDPAMRQARFLRTIADDRGRIPLLGDDDGGQLFPICGRPPADCADTLATAAVLLQDSSLSVGEPPEETFWLCGSCHDVETSRAHATGPGSAALTASGYCVSRNTRGDHLVFDCGPHGYLNGGHAHADALSVVLTVGGRPLLIDPGTATYTMNPEVRDRFRSTAMHNTLVIDGRTQSLPFGPFHWRTRADARCTKWESSPDRDVASGVHQGYAPFIHSREITCVHGVGWTIKDTVAGPGRVATASMWHFHPDWSLERIEGDRAHLRHRDGTSLVFLSSVPLQVANDPRLQEWAPEYGRIENALCLEATSISSTPCTLAAIVPADGQLETALKLASAMQLSSWPDGSK
jgi:hypothetical protein